MRALLSLAFIYCFLGCDPRVEIVKLKPENVLSVTCQISPQDSFFTAYVFRASPLGSTIWYDSASVKDATVIISDGITTDTLNLQAETNQISKRKIYKYTTRKKNVVVEAGRAYSLKVSTLDGLSLMASCEVPEAAGQVDVLIKRFGNDALFDIAWLNQTQHPYLSLILDAEGDYEESVQGFIIRQDLFPKLSDDAVFPTNRYAVENFYSGVIKNGFLAIQGKLFVSVRHVDSHLYHFYSSYKEYEQWASNSSGSLIPTFAEMPQVYSNVKGGVGVFGSFNDRRVEVAIR